LNTQYPFYKSVFGHSHVIPPGIDITNISRVIDVATGTGAWVLDFASLPEVQRRNIQIFACDIDGAKFLQGNKPQVAVNHISFFQQDVTKPFPDELLGTFDLVNLILLCCALTSQGWKMALENLRSLLSKWRTFPTLCPHY
jgi:SAM-dependent methyltransferase